ncbi:transcription termination factor NusA [Patescibacteria group bacterium]|nr:transcription termination factor NusA [Patescibacteria group bacterium]
MEIKSFLSAIEQICEEKGIAREKVIETIEMALAAAYKKEYGHKGQNIRVKFDFENGKMKVFQVKTIVDESMLRKEDDLEGDSDIDEKEELPVEGEEGERKIRFNDDRHIMLDEAKKLAKSKSKNAFKISKNIAAGDEIEFPLEAKQDFGRIAAQTAKQVIIQRIREAERESIYDEYKDREGEIISGIIQRMENNTLFIDIGKTTGILFPEEQIPGEHYKIGSRLKFYILEVQKDTRGPNIILSRAYPKMVSQLFALEVPEISAGTVEIKAIAREVGSRSKIAVSTKEERVDPIGSMIGQRGTRVQAVINELAGEKIDIIEWSEDAAKFITNALSPAKVINVKTDEKRKEAKVIVPEDQLSLAIGARGQNVRLAAKLTGWKIDIEAKKEKEAKPEKDLPAKKTKVKKTDEKAEEKKPKKKLKSKSKKTK